MKVKELIEVLSTLPPNAEVEIDTFDEFIAVQGAKLNQEMNVVIIQTPYSKQD